MPHSMPLVSTIVIGLSLAFALGAVANRLRLSPIAGFLLAGVAIGPFTPGFVGDADLAQQLAEVGVILLMFGVGLHFSWNDLLSVRAIALPGAVVQIGIATTLGWMLAVLGFGWTTGSGIIFGLALSVASTVVLLRALEERQAIDTTQGHIAVGWLIVEDLAMVVALVLIPALSPLLGGDTPEGSEPSSAQNIAAATALTLIKVTAFIALMVIVGRRVFPWALARVARSGSRELFTLFVLVLALGVAYAAATLFGVSFALGAFFAGMILSESDLSQRAAEDSLPLRDAFAVLFFISVGMLFDPMILIRDPLPVLATCAIIVVGKSLAALAIVLGFRHNLATALTIAASLAQIGEFSFILASLGMRLELLPPEGSDLILGGAILSILLNPIIFLLVDRYRGQVESTAAASAAVNPAPEAASALEHSHRVDKDVQRFRGSGHAVLVGFGRVGTLVGKSLQEDGSPLVVIESRRDRIGDLREQGFFVVFGNASRPEVQDAANVSAARWLIVAVPNAFEAGEIVRRARATNPSLKILARAGHDSEVEHLHDNGADIVIMGEREIARRMVEGLAVEGRAPPLASASV